MLRESYKQGKLDAFIKVATPLAEVAKSEELYSKLLRLMLSIDRKLSKHNKHNPGVQKTESVGIRG